MQNKTAQVEITDNELVTGSVTVKLPFYSERLRLLKEMDYALDEEGKMVASSGNPFERLAQMVEITERYIVSVDLVLKESGAEIKDVESLLTYEELQPILSHLSTIVLRGNRLGKS